MKIEMSSVESSNVAAIGYSEPDKVFAVKFKTGATYHYADVERKVADGIRSADSIGSAVHRTLIAGSYKTEKQPEPKKEEGK